MIDWTDPAARLRLAEQVGPDAYNAALEKHLESSTVSKINGYSIQPTYSRFGRLYAVIGSGMAFSSLPEAEGFASKLVPQADINAWFQRQIGGQPSTHPDEIKDRDELLAGGVREFIKTCYEGWLDEDIKQADPEFYAIRETLRATRA